MAGNVWEWVSDAGYDERELPAVLPSSLIPRVQKGGTLVEPPWCARLVPYSPPGRRLDGTNES
jgi:formylglycine-generating enzyme required for sulfatase activity